MTTGDYIHIVNVNDAMLGVRYKDYFLVIYIPSAEDGDHKENGSIRQCSNEGSHPRRL